MLKVRKNQAGGSSHGHEWPHDGAVVEIPVEHAHELLRIPDGGFSIVEHPAPEDELEPVAELEAEASKPSPRRRATAE